MPTVETDSPHRSNDGMQKSDVESKKGGQRLEDSHDLSIDDDEQLLPPPSAWFVDEQQQQQHQQHSSIKRAEEEDIASSKYSTNSECTITQEQQQEEDDTTTIKTTSSFGASMLPLNQQQQQQQQHLIEPYHTDYLGMVPSSPTVTPSHLPPVVTHPSPSWKEMSSHVLPAAARELLSSSWRRISYKAKRSYYTNTKWHRKHSDMGNPSGGYYVPPMRTNGGAKGGNNSHYSTTIAEDSCTTTSGATTTTELPPFSSLPWVDRQMVQEWRTYLPGHQTTDDAQSTTPASLEETDGEEIMLPNINNNGSPTAGAGAAGATEDDLEFDRARALVPNPLPRPPWHQHDVCFACHQSFGPARLRHHCRNCGSSLCHAHSSATHRLPHLGYDPDVPERVCDGCKRLLEDQNLAERIAWRLARCRDAEGEGESLLTPYFETGVDSAQDVARRVTKAAIAMAKSIPLGAQATVAVETVDVLRKYGLQGIYGIMVRQEFLAAADMLRRALGINKTSWPLSVHELSAAIFYALAQHRALRGLNPERENTIHTLRLPVHQQHEMSSEVVSTWTESDSVSNNGGGAISNNTARRRTRVPSMIDNNYELSALEAFHNNPVIDQTDTYNPESVTIENVVEPLNMHDPRSRESFDAFLHQPSFVPVCDFLPDAALNSLIFYAPIALNFVYATKEVDMQLLAAQQGWRLLYAYLRQDNRDSEHFQDRPASALFLQKELKVACLSIRGTATIQDVVTDIRQTPVPFPESPSEQLEKDGDWTGVCEGQGLALCGMASAAVNLFREHVDALVYFAKRGYRIRLVGHSLGGGVATMIGILLLRHLEQCPDSRRVWNIYGSFEDTDILRVYAYGTPSCLDAKLAQSVEKFATTVVLHDDVFPRLTPTSCRGLLKHLLHIRETWVKAHMEDDLRAVGERAKTVWAPRLRQSFMIPSDSSKSIKKYCTKKIKMGKKKLASVTSKIAVGDGPMCEFPSSFDNRSYGAGALEEESSSFASDPSQWGERFFVPSSIDGSIAQSLDTALQVEQREEQDNHSSSSEPPQQLLLEMLGGTENRDEGLVVDGDEFFDTEAENLIESDGDASETSSDIFADPVGSAVDGQSVSDSWSLAAEEKKTPLYSENDLEDNTNDSCPAEVVVDEVPLPRMFVPGKIVHIYAHHGVYKAAYVPRTFRELRRISMAGNMLSNHSTKSYYEGLLEVQTARVAPERPPQWTAFNEDHTCCCCASRFTWASTSDSEAQEARDKHNCRSCGGLVCDPCSKNSVPIPSIGVVVSVRVCDRCYHDMGGHSAASSSMTSSFLAVDDDDPNITVSTDDTMTQTDSKRPERKRDKRSYVVDDLASRIRASALTPCS